MVEGSIAADCCCRCSDDDLRRERGPVMQEYRDSRGAAGRASEAHWRLMLRGSRHAERLPIGTVDVIENVPAATVKAFYQRWYHPLHMAVVAVGDFEARCYWLSVASPGFNGYVFAAHSCLKSLARRGFEVRKNNCGPPFEPLQQMRSVLHAAPRPVAASQCPCRPSV